MELKGFLRIATNYTLYCRSQSKVDRATSVREGDSDSDSSVVNNRYCGEQLVRSVI